MAANSRYILACLSGLLIPGMGQLVLGRRLRGLMFFLLANILFISALLVLGARFYKALQIVPAQSGRWPLVLEQVASQGLGVLPVLATAYALLLIIAALDALYLGRKSAHPRQDEQ